MIVLVSIAIFIQIFFYQVVFSGLAYFKQREEETKKEGLTIVICYKNEALKIDHTLPKILEQDFDELILVNDNSTDDTLAKLKQYESSKMRILSIDHETQGKKKALLKGIQAATYNDILVTDADCIPASKRWAHLMGKSNKVFVLGYGPMEKTKGLVATFSRYETYMTALQYLSYAIFGLPYMGVGRNLRMDKRMVLENMDRVNGSHLASGDDDLTINLLATSQNTEVCLEEDSFVYSTPKKDLLSFLNQKVRHISTSPYYKLSHKFMLSLFSGSQLIFYMALIVGCALGTISISKGIFLIGVKWAFQQLINYQVMKKLKEQDLFWKFPLLDILYFLYLLILPLYFLVNKNKSTWN